ncbi:hypothetical protein BEP19_03600, partial [Ammoniphilus oxalaticus]
MIGDIKSDSQTQRMDKQLASVEKMDIQTVVEIVREVYRIDLLFASDNGLGRLPDSYNDELKRVIAQKMRLSPHSLVFMEQLRSMKKIELLRLLIEGTEQTGPRLRQSINQIFGMNLDGISTLENSGVSLFSKGQWLARKETDLLVAQTNQEDTTVIIFPTASFQSIVGDHRLSSEAHQALLQLGFAYFDEMAYYEYTQQQGYS